MAANRLQLYEYAGGKCVFCGRDVRENLARFHTLNGFEFNHINPKKKAPDYENLIRRNLSSEQLDEIDKCALMCRICHSIFHAQNITARGTISIRVGKMRRQQTYRAAGMADWKEKRLVLFSDQDDALAIFTAQYQRTPPRFMTKKDIEARFLPELLPAVKSQGSLLIRGSNRTPLLLVEPVDSDHFQIQMDVRCPLFQVELHEEQGKPVIWVRNGKAVTAEGEVLHQGVVTFYRLPYSEWCKAKVSA
ncbi:hypothetical protein J8F10_18530 [Gemmata sp. G18]|uniref:HNH nuclease domain-containing protein n=1 Tax=Gemmata palustris TaxID=2822762 RepID=A0ABS5BU61_9BACT|nr:hypothetical protein [Gemmata palustris]MBP3957261.1 hypothetical protein [Gemmata palustris]